MKVKLFHLFYIVLICAMCLLPLLGMMFQPTAEQELPALTTSEGGFNGDCLEEAETYMAEHFALRSGLRTLWAHFNAKLFRTSVDARVILGKDGWLYAAETAADYMGESMGEEALTYGARNLYLMHEYVRNNGAQLVFTISPNKNSLYPDHMPERYPMGTSSDATRLSLLLAEQGVPYVDLFTVFRQEEAVLYYLTDTRWTTRGAALAADTILQHFHKSTGYFDGTFQIKTNRSGNLYSMLYPVGLYTEAVDSYTDGFTFTAEAEDGTVTTVQEKARGHLVCWQDDFGSWLWPFLAEVYETAQFSEATEYDLTAVPRCHADAVIIELAESSLSRLVTCAPRFASPVRSVTVETYGLETLTGMGTAVEALHGLRVTVPRGLVDAGSSLYVKIGDTVYEGCVLWSEQELVCSVWVSEELPKAVELIGRKDGAATAYSCIING